MFVLSDDGKFATVEITRRVTIVEARGMDWFDWGNDEVGTVPGTVRPAFIAYLGCDNKQQALAAKLTVENVCGCYEIEVRSRRNTRTGYPIELKIRGLSRIDLEDLVTIGDRVEDEALYCSAV